ncbi:MAG: FtsQ-type POTRA domain-containing protein [Candidatus Moranbacteria bacterium]|nr:FtsQ-type POTRA domain-containing protein [Candidatus Moranbacteria bacterium]
MLEPGKSKSRAGSRMSDRNPRRIHWKRIFFYFFLLCFMGAAVFVLFFSPFLNVTEIRISGTHNISESDVREMIAGGLSGKYLGFIPKDNIIIFRSARMADEIKARFNMIRNIKIVRKFPNTLEISVAEHEMKLILCASGDCYYVDDNGSLFPKGMFSREEIKEDDYAVLNDTSGVGIDQKNDILGTDYMDFIFAIKDGLKDRLDIDLEREMETPSRVSSDLRVTTKEGWKIFFNEEADAEKEIEMLRIVLDEKIGKDKRGDLEYVDLRADNKVFYKFKGQDGQDMNQDDQNPSASSSSSSSSESDSKDKKKKKK